MLKKIIFLSVVISQLTISCSKNDDPVDETGQNLDTQIAEILKLPYSSLKPEQQKIKLEAEANDMLVQMDKTKTSSAIEAIQNLGHLLSIGTVDIFNGETENQIEDILNVSGTYGIYTWNSSNQTWIKTASTTELKFIFPAKGSLTANNATLSSKSTSSEVKGNLNDADQIYLPSSVDAILTIDNVQAASFITSAKFTNGKQYPDESSFKMVLSDGYTWEISGKKGQPNFVKSAFTFNGKNIIEFNSGSTSNIDGLLTDQTLVSYRGKANGLIRIMDNFVIAQNIDVEGLANDGAALQNSFPLLDYRYKTYYANLNEYNKKESEGSVLANNKNVKMALISKKDGTKIADVIQKSEKGYSYNSHKTWVNDSSVAIYGGYWRYDYNTAGTLIQEYDEVLYLKFNDNTEVALSVYFSSGFDSLNTKFQNFLNAF